MKYTLGTDFGTLSGRTALFKVGSPDEICCSVYEYPHAVITADSDFAKKLFGELPQDFALQHPQDYLDVLSVTIPDVINKSGVDPKDIIGIGIDFTACTMLPVYKDGTPLCFTDKFRCNPYSYVKLWKHHAAQDKANRLNETAHARGEKWINAYGGKISSEWMFPKIWETLDKAPDVYDAADSFVEAADWVISRLCGKETRNSCTAGYKAMWNKRDGFPSKEFFAALDKRLENVIEEKLSCPVTAIGSKAGEITKDASMLTGLCEGTAVAVANVDAHVTVPALGMKEKGNMLMIMGTSTCHMLVSDEDRYVPGICGSVEDGILPGMIGYEAGQSCVGDSFAWFTDNLLNAEYAAEAKEKGLSAQQLLAEKAAMIPAGKSGLLALDWWNGNRSILVDVDLSGMILGLTLATKPEEIYKAIVESTAYGTRMIIENYENHGVPVTGLYAAGGIAAKSPETMQIYADVTGLEIRISGSSQAPALGSAIFGAVAAGKERGGYDSVFEAADEMGSISDVKYVPNKEAKAVYDELFEEYKRLHDYFGRGENDVMKRLKKLKDR
jgi:L-ribulokinase